MINILMSIHGGCGARIVNKSIHSYTVTYTHTPKPQSDHMDEQEQTRA